MNLTAVSTGRWTVSARPGGEVLVARHGDGEAELFLLGVPPGFAITEIEAWLRDVLAVARETAKSGGESPIPVILHHTLTGLLFSHAELWSRGAGTPPGSLAFVKTEREAAFGWVGDMEPRVWLAGQPADIGWVVVRDERGNEARAFAVDANVPVRIALEWSPLPGAIGVPGVEVVADWGGAVVARSAPALETAPAPPAIAAPAFPPVAPAPPAFIPTTPHPGEAPSSALAPEAAAEPEAREPVPVLEERTSPPAPSPWRSVEADAAGVPPALEPEVAPVVEAPREAPPAPVIETPATGWTTVYEGEARQGAGARPRGGFGAWLKGLFGARSREEIEPAPALPASDRARMVGKAEVVLDEAGAAPEVAPDALAGMIPPTPEPAEVTARAVGGTQGVEPAPAAPAEPPASGVEEVAPAGPAPPVESYEEPAPRPLVLEPLAPMPPAAASEAPGPPAAESRADAALEPGSPLAPPARPRRRWPEPEVRAPRPAWRRPGVLIAGFLALFAGGWIVGGIQQDRSAGPRSNAISRALHAMGLGGARYQVTVNSLPPGAWIAVDGKDLALRTPATLDLVPGRHDLSLSMSDLGSAAFEVRGERGERVSLDAALWGHIDIGGADMTMPIAASVDGREVGFVPVALDSVLPGTHEVRFSGPGMVSWGQTVQVRIGETAAVIARPMTSPATGLIEVRASLTDESGTSPVSGAAVWVDGDRKGATPVTLELPRGPHSLRVEYQGERAPVQVIDLPGGNQRFATFEFGLGADRPELKLVTEVPRMSIERPAVISAALMGVGVNDVREMWLHARTSEGTWRRYQMVMLKATGGVVGTAVYPPAVADGTGHASWYVSALTASGDEYFTELQSSEMESPAGAARAR